MLFLFILEEAFFIATFSKEATSRYAHLTEEAAIAK